MSVVKKMAITFGIVIVLFTASALGANEYYKVYKYNQEFCRTLVIQKGQNRGQISEKGLELYSACRSLSAARVCDDHYQSMIKKCSIKSSN